MIVMDKYCQLITTTCLLVYKLEMFGILQWQGSAIAVGVRAIAIVVEGRIFGGNVRSDVS